MTADIIQKENHYRSQKFLDYAEGEECTMRSPMCNNNPATVISAHSNLLEDGKGRGIKAHDDLSVYACDGCHYFYDKSDASKRLKQAYFDRAFRRTYKRRRAQGIIRLTP